LKTRAIALIIVFVALSIALTPVAVPAVYMTGFFYRFWEIPIVIAFLLFGVKLGVAVTVLRTLAELTLFLGPAGVVGPLAALGGTLSMLLGIYLAGWLLKHKASQDRNSGIKSATYYTALGALFRMLIAPLVMYPVWRFFLPQVLSDVQIIALVPPVMLFALTLCLYTIPIGYLVAKIVNKTLAVGNRL
jgi:riboflavin transporter FmnP